MRYKVDLKNFMADCEANYYRLQRLFPRMATIDCHSFGLSNNSDVKVRFKVVERAPYTSMLMLSQSGADCQNTWDSIPAMTVRVYHDAKMAEVVSCAAIRRVQPRYVYPNKQMHQPDEKAQWNRFLAEWLSICLRTGYAVVEPHESIES